LVPGIQNKKDSRKENDDLGRGITCVWERRKKGENYPRCHYQRSYVGEEEKVAGGGSTKRIPREWARPNKKGVSREFTGAVPGRKNLPTTSI